jgi:hypothetical protein
MLETLHTVLTGALAHLHRQITTYVPALLAALTLLLAAWALALGARWLIYRIFKGLTIDRFLRQSGMAFVVDPSGRLRATRIVAELRYLYTVLGGALVGLNVFGTELTTRIVQSLVFLLPKLVVAGAILLAGLWLGQYLGRSMLVWAVNENFPGPRRLATAVRILIMFIAVVVAADQLDFAREVFLAAFIIFVGGAVLAASLAVGLSAGGFRRVLDAQRDPQGETGERSLWNHL